MAGKEIKAATKKNEETFNQMRELVEQYYRKIMRVVEFYVMISFVIITIVPLLDYSWVPPFIKFVYFTGFPLLILLFIISLFKDSLLDFLARRLSSKNA